MKFEKLKPPRNWTLTIPRDAARLGDSSKLFFGPKFRQGTETHRIKFWGCKVFEIVLLVGRGSKVVCCSSNFPGQIWIIPNNSTMHWQKRCDESVKHSPFVTVGYRPRESVTHSSNLRGDHEKTLPLGQRPESDERLNHSSRLTTDHSSSLKAD